MDNGIIANLRAVEQCCFKCRYYRLMVPEPGRGTAFGGQCLLLGRSLSIANDEEFCDDSDRQRVCDLWKKRPKKWEYKTEENPFWKDKYLSREKLISMRKHKGLQE